MPFPPPGCTRAESSRRRSCSRRRSPGPARCGSTVIVTSPYWPRPPVWRMKRCLCLGDRRDRLLVGDLGLADVRLHLELAHHAVDDDLEVQLAHAGDDRLAGLLVRAHAERRVLLGELRERRRHLLLVDLGLGLDRDLDHRLGEVHRLEHDRVFSSHSVSPVRHALQADDRGDVAGRRPRSISSRLLACICSRRPMRSFLPVVAFSTWSRLDLARVDAEERQLADVRVGHDLEHERRERLVVARLARSRARSCSGRGPRPAACRAGDGRKSTTASSSGCTPLFLNAEPHSTGMIVPCERALAHRALAGPRR